MTTPSKFRYTVKTVENKTLTGVIAASSMDVAQKNLQKLGYTVLSLMPLLQESDLTEKRVFSFEAKNREGKKILGTITTRNEFTARRKLEHEHKLQVFTLQEMKQQGPMDKKEQGTIQEEVSMVLQKAEQVLASISPYDHDYNAIFDAKEELRQLLRNGEYKKLEQQIIDVLQLLQDKEKATVLGEKEILTDTVVKTTEDLITSIKVEAGETTKHVSHFYINAVLRELTTLSGWLLAFYGLYFVFAELVTAKQISGGWVVFLKNTLLSPLLFKITISVLLIHVYCRVKIFWFERKMLSSILLAMVVLLFIFWTFLV